MWVVLLERVQKLEFFFSWLRPRQEEAGHTPGTRSVLTILCAGSTEKAHPLPNGSKGEKETGGFFWTCSRCWILL